MHADAALVERFVAAELARADLYFFARHMFRQRRGFQWQRAPHHRLICDALMRVYRGECKRLIINIPPRYSKTELAVVMFIAWALGQAPDAEFIHTSYSATLTGENSSAVRDLIGHEEYQAIFPAVELAGEARSHWSTTAGGVMYSTGAGGSLTGFGAGKMRPGFGGCFPAGTRVWTEAGAIPIDRIVRERLALRVWSYDYAGRMVLRPVVGWHKNPPSAIVRITFDDGGRVECTPDHQFLTEGRGWARADSLREDDRLPRVRGGVQGLDDVGVNAQRGGRGLDATPILPPGPVGAVGQGDISLRPCEDRSGISAGAAFGGDVAPASDGCPGVAAPDLIDHRNGDSGLGGQDLGWRPNGAVDCQRLRVREQGARVALGLAERTVRLAVGDLPRLAANSAGVAHGVSPFISGHRKPVLVEFVRHDESTFCLTVEEHHNFTVECGFVVKNCIIIDDPHKADEARSDTVRQGVIDWFQNTLESRKNDPARTPVIVIMQRLHEKDLAGWLLGGGNGEKWGHLCLSAWQDDGTPLWPEKHDADELRRMEAAAPYTFAGQYRQRPAPPDGLVFKPSKIETVDALPAGPIQWARGWDFADSTKGDFTAGGKVGKLRDGRYIIGGMERERFTTDARDKLLLTTTQRDGTGVRVSLPQDPGQAGKGQVLALTRMLAGYPVRSSPETGDKVVRAEAFAAQVNVGNVLMLRGPWNDPLVDEMKTFPNGSFDDQIDALSRAFNELFGSGHPAISTLNAPGL